MAAHLVFEDFWAIATSRSNGFIAALAAGVFLAEGSPTMPPHRFGTTNQVSFGFGLMAHCAPMSIERATITVAATKSGGHGIRLASSMTQGRNASGSRIGSNGMTGFNSPTIGSRFGQSPGDGLSLRSAACRASRSVSGGDPIFASPPSTHAYGLPVSGWIDGGSVQACPAHRNSILHAGAAFAFPSSCHSTSSFDCRSTRVFLGRLLPSIKK